VGWWIQFAAVGNGQSLPDDFPLTPLGRHRDWEFARLPDDWSLDASDVVERLATTLDAPAIGAYVADSDAAACYFAPVTGKLAALTINASYDDADELHTEQWVNPDLHRAAAQALSDWAARYAPRKPSAEEIIEKLRGLEDEQLSSEIGNRSLVFAEDGLRVIFNDLLGIADIDQVVLAD
jgi:hypothetical protein